MLLKVKPKKMSVYTTNGKMTCAQVRNKTGCDICINGTLYNFSDMKPVCDVKIDGAVLSNDQYNYWGYGWNENDSRATMSDQMSQWYNYISCAALVRNGKVEPMYYGSGIGGQRGRTAIGYMDDGTMVIYCYQDGSSGACTPEQLATKMLSYGCVDALMLDGGGSVQIDCDEGKITSSRKVANYICIWTDRLKENSATDECPYTEPTFNIRHGSAGTGAKWVQWYLNKHGAELTVDGAFGAKSVKALITFQKSKGLTADGVCGAQTRLVLKSGTISNVVKPTAPTTSSDCPYTKPSKNLKYGMSGNNVKWLQWHLNKHGANITIDGSFGGKTLLAVKKFQKVNGLTQDGVVGANTRNALCK